MPFTTHNLERIRLYSFFGDSLTISERVQQQHNVVKVVGGLAGGVETFFVVYPTSHGSATENNA